MPYSYAFKGCKDACRGVALSVRVLIVFLCCKQSFGLLRFPFDIKSIRKEILQPTHIERNVIGQVGAISSPLGTSLDNYHGLFHALEYNKHISSIQVYWPKSEQLILSTSHWTPILFAFAGAIMSYLLFAFEKLYIHKSTSQSLQAQGLQAQGWPQIFNGIGIFSFQYYISGLLDHEGIPTIYIHGTLALLAFLGMRYNAFFTVPGILLGLATAIAGPVVEACLINFFDLYTYTHADLTSYRLCSWIPWIYLLGAPAVGSLALGLRQREQQRLMSSE